MHGYTYEVYVYIESRHFGAFSAAIPVTVEWFAVTPHVVGVVTPFGFSISFKTHQNGRAFGVLEQGGTRNSTHTNASSTCEEIKRRAIAETTILHRSTTSPRFSCAFDNVTLSAGVASRYDFSRCYQQSQSDDAPLPEMLIAGDSYNVWICVEAPDHTSTVAPRLVVQIPSVPSLMFVGTPSIVGVVSSDGVTIGFKTTGSGHVSAVLVSSSATPYTAASVKYPSIGDGMHCNATGMIVNTGTTNITLDECGLLEGVTYEVFLLIEDRHYGSLSGPITVVVPWFLDAPRITGIITPYGISVAFTTTASGVAYGMIELGGGANSSSSNTTVSCEEVKQRAVAETTVLHRYTTSPRYSLHLRM
jgi:hypothetical protein